MYLLQFLTEATGESAPLHGVAVEYRLACSGELYNRTVSTADWRKSDVTRILLRRPIEIFVASRPFESYPQELCSRFTVRFVTETIKNSSATFLPDEDVIEDLCSVLTLLSRRLISPAQKTMQRDNDVRPGSSLPANVPMPILRRPDIAVWKRRPLGILTSVNGQRIVDDNPPPVGVAPDVLERLLLALPRVAKAQQIIYASRPYRTALEFIEARPDISYALLVSCAETLANAAFMDFDPTDAEKVKAKLAVFKEAVKYGLDESKAKTLAVDACKGDRWARRKFRKFLLEFGSTEELAQKDTLFLVPEPLNPDLKDIEGIFGQIYDARSGHLHAGSPYPATVGVETSFSIDGRHLPALLSLSLELPPAAWFERAVSIAAKRFLFEQTSVTSAPFSEYGS